MSELEKYIQTYFGVPTDDLSNIVSFFTPRTLPKGRFYLKTGGQSDRLGFVQSGFIREYVEVNDREVTKWISTKGYFVVDLSSFIFHQPARWTIQALTDCELFVINRTDYERMGGLIPKWHELEKLFIAKCFTVLEERIVRHLSLTAEKRYRALADQNRELFDLVPLQYLASMLGMTPETLSRLRRKPIG